MVSEALFVLLGLVILLSAGELLVRGAVDLARALGVPALVVSLTIVAFGTSAPELVVSIQAVIDGSGGIALGNIIGSNIANILMVLGIPAIVYPMSAHVPRLRRHATVLLLGTITFAYAAYNIGAITRPVGFTLFGGIIIYLSYMLFDAMRGDGENPVLDEVEDYSDKSGITIMTIAFLLIGLIGLPVGAHLLVTNGAKLAAEFGVREELIGLTVIAFGTSLPELATVLSAAIKKKSDVAIGSVVGSNIFNLLAVGGATGIAGGASFDNASLGLDIPIMIGATLILCGFIYARQDIGRVAGLIMAIGYVIFCIVLMQTATISA